MKKILSLCALFLLLLAACQQQNTAPGPEPETVDPDPEIIIPNPGPDPTLDVVIPDYRKFAINPEYPDAEVYGVRWMAAEPHFVNMIKKYNGKIPYAVEVYGAGGRSGNDLIPMTDFEGNEVGISENELKEIVREALLMWTNAFNSRGDRFLTGFEEVAAISSTTHQPGLEMDGVLRIYLGPVENFPPEIQAKLNPPAPAPFHAVAVATPLPDRLTFNVHVPLNYYTYQPSTNPNSLGHQMYVQKEWTMKDHYRVLLNHEIAHIFGLGHNYLDISVWFDYMIQNWLREEFPVNFSVYKKSKGSYLGTFGMPSSPYLALFREQIKNKRKHIFIYHKEILDHIAVMKYRMKNVPGPIQNPRTTDLTRDSLLN